MSNQTWVTLFQYMGLASLLLALASFIGVWVFQGRIDDEKESKISGLVSTVQTQKTTIAALDQKTKDVGELPDGRRMHGNTISGTPYILDEAFKKIVPLYNAGKHAEVLELARDWIDRYERTQAILSEGVKMLLAPVELTAETVSAVYAVGGQSAGIMKETELGLTWCRKAVKVMPSLQNRAALANALYKAGKVQESEELIRTVFASGGEDAAKFKQMLEAAGFRFTLKP